MRAAAILVSCALALVLPGCTAANWYQGTATSARLECERQPPGAREDCLAKLQNLPYERYTRERDKAAGQGGTP